MATRSAALDEGFVALATDARDSGGDKCQSLRLDGFPCHSIKLVGKRHLVAALQQELPVSNYVHQLDAGQYAFG